jgi:hypothetical protein
MTTTFAVGDVVECLDDTDGAHFLEAGKRYTVHHVQGEGEDQRVALDGVAIAFEAARFRLLLGVGELLGEGEEGP